MDINTDDPNDEPTQEEIDAHDFLEAVKEFSSTFDELCQARHNEGEEKYGSLTWLGNDVVRMMLEELADTVNYCRYQAIKLLLLQSHLEVELADTFGDGDSIDEITIGVRAFKGTKDVGWRK